ncbi:MAG: hypothetical protein VYA21_06725 [Verrucomicrobiota bacterium]|nr:hypothetical protein [Verrucomicrobiota bacterium]
MIKTIPIFFSLLMIVCTVRASEPPLGMWAWKQTHFDTAQARSEMLDFCEQEGISHIDQHVVIHNNIITNVDALKCLIAQAAQRGITVNALRGDKAMFLADNHESTLNAIETLVAFNRTLPEEAKLLGIKFDVEPYLSAQWKAGVEQRDRVILEYLNCLTRARAYLNTHSPKLELAVDVPFWWDKDEYKVNFEGSTEHFVHHIQNRVDWIGIMSYRREANKIIRLVEDELLYASKHGQARSVAPSMETSNIKGKEAHISFGGVPTEQFRVELASLRSTYADNSIIRCVMLHHYDSLRSYLKRD